MSQEEKNELVKELNNAYENKELPKFYANGFSGALGVGDVVLVLKQGPTNVALINLSYTTAKTIAIKLGTLIDHLEKMSGNTIMTIDDVKKYFEVE